VDPRDWEGSWRPATFSLCPARTRTYPPRISCRSCTPGGRPRSGPKAASARSGRRRICVCSARRRFRLAIIYWRDRPPGGPAALLPVEWMSVRRQEPAVPLPPRLPAAASLRRSAAASLKRPPLRAQGASAASRYAAMASLTRRSRPVASLLSAFMTLLTKDRPYGRIASPI
jgi:hypothetical protein